jgi:hypothetical protein
MAADMAVEAKLLRAPGTCTEGFPSPDGSRAMDDRFLLKLVTVETIILVTLWTLVVVYHDYFAWLLS